MDVDDATSAMIAQVLAEENPYQFEDFDEPLDDDPDDSDYGSPTRPKRKRNPQGGGRKARVQAPPVEAPKRKSRTQRDEESESDIQSATGRRKRKDTGVPRAKGRPWTDDEEKLFLEGLELHGRDWKNCAKYVGTRDAKSLTSHAQKHFIKMCMRGLPLPPKVSETGVGYTLSGKLLDPTSTSAKAYGFNPHALKELSEEGYRTALNGIIAEKLPESEAVIPAPGKKRRKSSKFLSTQDNPPQGGVSGEGPSVSKADALPSTKSVPDAEAQIEDVEMKEADPSSSKKTDACPAAPGDSGKDAENTNKDVKEPALPSPSHRQVPANDPGAVEVRGQTEYARARPRRTAPRKKVQMGHTTESLDLVKCLSFVSGARSGTSAAQPYTVEVSNQALLTMDCHAHLSECEIIGLLGGKWDPEKRHLVVSEAFPCAREAGSEARTSVELDPEAEVQARAQMQNNGLQGVGWYHSHPVFEPAPSKKDMENQRNYQALFRDEASMTEPFVGFIVGPYDPQLLSPHSASTAFIVQEKESVLRPFRIQYSIIETSEVPQPKTIKKLHALFDSVKTDVARVDFSQKWRPFTALAEGHPEGPPLTKLQKFESSLKSYFPEGQENEADEFLASMCRYIENSWGVEFDKSNGKIECNGGEGA
ncbi:hypothetical protein BSKO_06138 [Bryopsis sp. KO-2023]|nr:hypothetical protein BSKO_06138 [Bryopsis sp. KO-2023]